MRPQQRLRRGAARRRCGAGGVCPIRAAVVVCRRDRSLSRAGGVAIRGSAPIFVGDTTVTVGNLFLLRTGCLGSKNDGETTHVDREIAKRSGCIPKPCPQEQNPGDRVSRERCQAARDHHLVRQFLRAAAARCALAAGLQARDLDGHAGTADPAVRGQQGARRALNRSDLSSTAPTSRTLVIHPATKPASARRSEPPGRSLDARLDEAVALARAIERDVIRAEIVRIARPAPATLFGSGNVESLRAVIADNAIGLVIVDATLSPVQQRNLERRWQAKVIDRTGLILEIFGARARTHEGRLQVELAALSYQRSRLVRSWTHLERQRGGFGFLGGPGESQLEIDRRLITDRIAVLKKELEGVKRTRQIHRGARKRVPYPVVALVGYTNAGKSTLFNRLTRAEVVAEDLLFATLDPTMRRLPLPSGRFAILSDTVGFVSDLPTHLVAAFRATLEEVTEADLVVHVRDAHHPDSEPQRADVLDVLRDLGLADIVEGGLVEALNKIDLLEPERRAFIRNQATRNHDVVPISAATGEGCDELLALFDRRLGDDLQLVRVDVPISDGAALAWLYQHGDVVNRSDDEHEAHVTVRM